VSQSAAVVPKGLILSLIVVCILAFTGWKGWDMVYRGRVGIADANDAYGRARTPRLWPYEHQPGMAFGKLCPLAVAWNGAARSKLTSGAGLGASSCAAY